MGKKVMRGTLALPALALPAPVPTPAARASTEPRSIVPSLANAGASRNAGLSRTFLKGPYLTGGREEGREGERERGKEGGSVVLVK